MSYQHSKIIDFTIPYWISDIIFFLRKGKQKSKLYAITYPFDIEVWIATIITFFVGTIFFYLIFNMSAKFYSDKKTSLYAIVMAIFASFTNQGNDIFQPTGQSRKLLVIMWILATSILGYSYSGCLMSFLTFPGLEDVPRTFPCLFQAVKNGDYTLSTYMNSAIGAVVKKGETELTATMKKFFAEGKLVHSEKRHYFQRKFACISFNNEALLKIKIIGEENYLCSTDNLFMTLVSFGLRKNFPLKTEFDQILRRCLEAGIQEKFLSDELLRHSNERQSLFVEPDDFHPITLHDLFGSFGILIIGYIISTIIFILEIIVKQISSRYLK
ncbi:glutamate receptor ionotropic, kainate glr-3-like [Centruroides vittatus]|uniref:glutamate receptor ionotropic, kainate glr-3-like n=1 Tax=Centruroides vittatus TaxID=120091 RepID=UPI00350EB8FE